MVLDNAAVRGAFEIRPVRRGLAVPFQVVEFQDLPDAAMRTPHVQPPLIRGLELLGDPAHPLDAGRRHVEPLAPVRPCRGPRLRHGQRVAALAGVVRPLRDFLGDQVACRNHLQARRRIRPGHLTEAPGESLVRRRRSGRGPAFLVPYLALERRRYVDGRLQLGPVVLRRFVQRRQHNQHRPRFVVDHEAEQVDAGLRSRHLVGFLEGDIPARMGRR